MTVTPGFRRAAVVMLTAGLLMSAPGIAQAVFTSRVVGEVAASTLSLAAPVGADVTASCTSTPRRLSVVVNNFGTVPRATSLELTVTDPTNVVVHTGGAAYTRNGAAKGTWKIQIKGLYTVNATNIWRGLPYERLVECL
ncbi:hypothetical protein [Arthrobacter pascens]|uniref:hypothetical protein n=1 Tax=Arthrobacter pascens TaxID=1677 RepID=UPI00196AE888|nr:hypothetical protein [Arthrobacter pascens]MBN3499326.1 hypothetical protein [Arthrobacter pascens]